MNSTEKVTSVLETHGIAYQILRHAAVVTCEESRNIMEVENCCACKNLLLKARNSGKIYLLVLRADRHADLRAVSGYIGAGRLCLVTEEELKEILDVTRGSVSPFALLNDTKRRVRLLLDKDILNAERVKFHPNDNTVSIVLSLEDFLTFLQALKITFLTIDFS